MRLTAEQLDGLNVALNEATLLGVEFDPGERVAGVTLDVLALPPDAPERDDGRVLLVLEPVGGIAASLRHGTWDERSARVERFGVDEIHGIVAQVAGNPIYGWEFFDAPAKSFRTWSDRLSLDWHSDLPDGRNHSLDLFQEADSHLDLRIWFDGLRIVRADGTEVPLETFVSEGRRWWDAFHRHDPRTARRGLVPLRSSLSVRALGFLLRLTPWRKGGEL